ncbi:MAG: serine/threonine protein kinase [Acidobacteria bacterium]|nr:serine/threonine protein kinase [Acidobacteriota bacterium]
MTLVPGTKLGPYEIVSPLGAGGMGEVWKAKDTRLDRFVAVKVLPARLSKDAELLARFEREARAVAALNHPNIMALHDIGTQDGVVYAVMELLEGESLRTRLEQGPLPARKAIELAVQAARGLAAAHEKGVVHRDLKPDNLWVTNDGRLKILDFGLAKQLLRQDSAPNSLLETEVLPSGEAGSTERGTILGTVGYMSPEQVRGESVDARSDLFSFGAVLFEMLTGTRSCATTRRNSRRRRAGRFPRGSSGSCTTAWRRAPTSASARPTTSPSRSRTCRAPRSARSPSPPPSRRRTGGPRGSGAGWWRCCCSRPASARGPWAGAAGPARPIGRP